MKKMSVRLNDDSERRLAVLYDFYNNDSEYSGISKVSLNDLIQLALRALYEDCGLDE